MGSVRFCCPNACRDGVCAARYRRMVRRKEASAVELREKVFGNSSTRIIFFALPLLLLFCEAVFELAGVDDGSGSSKSRAPNLPPRPRKSSNCAAGETKPVVVLPAGFFHSRISDPMSFARRRTVVVFPVPAAPFNINSRCLMRPPMTSSSHFLTSATFFLCTASSSRFRGPNRSDHGRKSSFRASVAAGRLGLRNLWLKGSELLGAGWAPAALFRRFRTCCPTKLDELALTSDMSSSSDMISSMGSSTGSAFLSVPKFVLVIFCACLEKSIFKSAVFPLSSTLLASLLFLGLKLVPFLSDRDGRRGLPLLEDWPLAVFLFTGLGDAVGARIFAGELGDDRRKLVKRLGLGCSSSSSDASTVFRRRRFAGGAINATQASVLPIFHAIQEV